MISIRHPVFAASLAILGLALIAAGCGTAPEPVGTSASRSPATEAQTEATPTAPEAPKSEARAVATPTSPPPATATQPPRPADTPTKPPEPTDTASAPTPADTEAELAPLSETASRIDLSQIMTVLPVDAIPAILDPQFVTVEKAASQMSDSEDVIGVSINGESHAYPINMLSSHEIVNDNVGGVAIAVTW